MSLIKDPSLSMSLTLKLCLCPFNCFHVSGASVKRRLSLSLAFSFFFFKAPSDTENWTSEVQVWPEEETSQVLLGPK